MFCLCSPHLEALKILQKINSIKLRKASMAAISLDSCGPHITSQKNVNESCSKTTKQKWIQVNKKHGILGNIHALNICYMFALKSEVNLMKWTTKVRTHDVYTVLLVLKLGLVVNIIIIVIHQVSRSLYKPPKVTILIQIQ